MTITTFGTEATTIDKVFGHDVTVTPSPKNNLIDVMALGNRNVQKLACGKYEGALSIAFTLANSYWLRAVLGAVSDAGTDPTTHTYTEANTIPSITVEVGYDLGTTDCVRKFLGVKVVSARITGAVGEVAKVTLDCLYQKEGPRTTTLDGTPATETIAPMVFSQGVVKFPSSGTTIANVQNIEMTIDNGLLTVYGLGSRSVNALAEGARKYSGTVSHTFEEAGTNSTLAYMGTGDGTDITEGTSIQMQFSNGLSGASTRTIQLTLGDVKIDTDDMPVSPNELVVEDASFRAEEVDSCTGLDNVAAAP